MNSLEIKLNLLKPYILSFVIIILSVSIIVLSVFCCISEYSQKKSDRVISRLESQICDLQENLSVINGEIAKAHKENSVLKSILEGKESQIKYLEVELTLLKEDLTPLIIKSAEADREISDPVGIIESTETGEESATKENADQLEQEKLKLKRKFTLNPFKWFSKEK